MRIIVIQGEKSFSSAIFWKLYLFDDSKINEIKEWSV